MHDQIFFPPHVGRHIFGKFTIRVLTGALIKIKCSARPADPWSAVRTAHEEAGGETGTPQGEPQAKRTRTASDMSHPIAVFRCDGLRENRIPHFFSNKARYCRHTLAPSLFAAERAPHLGHLYLALAHPWKTLREVVNELHAQQQADHTTLKAEDFFVSCDYVEATRMEDAMSVAMALFKHVPRGHRLKVYFGISDMD